MTRAVYYQAPLLLFLKMSVKFENSALEMVSLVFVIDS